MIAITPCYAELRRYHNVMLSIAGMGVNLRFIIGDAEVFRSEFVSRIGEMATETHESCLTHYTIWAAGSILRNNAIGTAPRCSGAVAGADR